MFREGAFCSDADSYTRNILIREIVKQLVCFALLIIYLRLIYVFQTKTKYSSYTFYRFVCMNGYLACGTYLSYLTIKIIFVVESLNYEATPQLEHWKAVLIFNTYALNISSNIGQLLLALNRLTAVKFRQNYQRFWKCSFWYLIVVVMVFPFILVPRLWGLKGGFYMMCYDDLFFFDHVAPTINFTVAAEFWANYIARVLCFDCLFVIGGGIANGITVRLFRNYHSTRRFVFGNKTVHQAETSLLIMSWADFFVSLYFCLNDILTHFALYIGGPIVKVASISRQLNEIILIAPGLFIIVCSRRIRKEFFTKNSQ